MDVQQAEQKLSNYAWMVSALIGFVLIFVVSMTAFMLWEATRVGVTAAEVKNVAIESHQGLCALKGDIERRHESTAEYLQAHKDPYILGISRETFEKSLRDQESTLEALAVVDCS